MPNDECRMEGGALSFLCILRSAFIILNSPRPRGGMETTRACEARNPGSTPGGGSRECSMMNAECRMKELFEPLSLPSILHSSFSVLHSTCPAGEVGSRVRGKDESLVRFQCRAWA